MAIVKSKLLKQLKQSYPNFSLKDLTKLTDIILNEIKKALRRGENVELRNWGTMKIKIQKSSIRRNPKTGTKINVPKKRTIKWKMSKDLFKKLNNEKGDLMIQVAKTSKNKDYHIDALAGATLTSNGVNNLVKFWMGKDGFKKFLKNLKSGEA